MTFRELIKFCYYAPGHDCSVCERKKECDIFERDTNIAVPCTLYEIIYSKFDLDCEIEVEE